MNSINYESEHNPQPLQPFSYPVSIRILFLIILYGIFIDVPYFLYYELPLHRKVNTQIKHAELLFNEKKYVAAAQSYEKLIHEFKDFKDGRIKMAQACFALSQQYDELGDYNNYANYAFNLGLYCLSGYKFEKTEIENLKKYVQASRIDEFNNLFITKN